MNDRRLFFLLFRANRVLLGRAGAVLDEALGISVSQLTTLLYVASRPGCSMTELADLLDLNKSAVTGLVQRMERAGTLARSPNPDDGRGSRLELTAKGDELRERARPLIRRLNASITAGFTPEEIEVVLRFLNAIVDEPKEQP